MPFNQFVHFILVPTTTTGPPEIRQIKAVEAFQISTHAGPQYAAGKSIDGVKTTSGCSHTLKEINPWWSADLGVYC